MKKQYGFTFIETMITVLIVGILASVAYPSYMSSVRKTNRSDAKVALTDAAQRLQRCYTALGKFNDTTGCAVAGLLAGGGIASKYYNVTFSGTPTATSYTLQAVASALPQTKDVLACRTLTYDQNGITGPTDCW